MTEDLYLGWVFIIFGIVIVLFSKKVSKLTVKIDKLANINTNPFQVKFRQVLYVFGGLILFFMGLSSVYHHYHILGNH